MKLRRAWKPVALFIIWAVLQQVLPRYVPWTLPELVYSWLFSFLEWYTPGNIPYPEDMDNLSGLIVFFICSSLAALMIWGYLRCLRYWKSRRTS